MHRRFVRIVTFGADEDDSFILPAAYPLAMATKIPVLLTIGMAGTANEVRLVKIDILVTCGAQKIDVVAIVAGQAPEPVAAMINFTYMPCLQSARFRVRIPFIVATRTVLEFQLIVAWLDSELGSFGIALSGLAGISLPGTSDARCCDRKNYRQQT